MPYIEFAKTDTDVLVGMAITVGYLPQENCFQIALTIFDFTIGIGWDFDY